MTAAVGGSGRPRRLLRRNSRAVLNSVINEPIGAAYARRARGHPFVCTTQTERERKKKMDSIITLTPDTHLTLITLDDATSDDDDDVVAVCLQQDCCC